MECQGLDETLPRNLEVTSMSTESVHVAPVKLEELSSKDMGTTDVDDLGTDSEAAEAEQMENPDPESKYNRIALRLREMKKELKEGSIYRKCQWISDVMFLPMARLHLLIHIID